MPLHGALSPAFADLVGFQIHDVLFVLSHYDSFILAEDGQLDDRVLSGFLDLNLRTLPGVIQVESGDEALERIARMPDRFQLVIASPDLGDMDIGTFAHRLRHAVKGESPPEQGLLRHLDRDLVRRHVQQ